MILPAYVMSVDPSNSCTVPVCQDVLHLRLGLLQLLYAAALIPIGLLADRVNRPRLLAGGLVMWSLLTMTGSKVM